MDIRTVNLADKFALFSEHWTPKIVGEVDNYHIKLAKVQGDFVWHHHDEEDELFLVVKGQLIIQLRDQDDLVLNAGELAVIPKGVEHCPRADEECQILLFERQGLLNTGNMSADAKTVANPERI